MRFVADEDEDDEARTTVSHRSAWQQVTTEKETLCLLSEFIVRLYNKNSSHMTVGRGGGLLLSSYHPCGGGGG